MYVARESVHQVMESVGLGLEKGQSGAGGGARSGLFL